MTIAKTIMVLFLFIILLPACSDEEQDVSFEDGDTTEDGDTSEDGDATEDGDTPMDDDLFANNRVYIPEAPMELTYREAWNFCGSGEFNGVCGWRLPTLLELRSLVQGCPVIELGGDCPAGYEKEVETWGCGPCQDGTEGVCLWDSRLGRSTCPRAFWSSEEYTFASSPYPAYLVDFAAGEITYKSTDRREAFCHMELGGWGYLGDVLCILDETNNECLSPFTPYPSNDRQWTPEGGVLSGSDGLVWTQGQEPSLDASQAQTHCENLTLGGYEDWRLPMIEELRSLAVGCPNLPSASSYAGEDGPPPDHAEPGACCEVADDNCLSISCLSTNNLEKFCACYRTPGWDEGCYLEADIWQGGCDTAFRSASEVGDMSGHHWVLHYGDPDTRTRTGWDGPQIAPVPDDQALSVRCVRGEAGE